MKNKFFKTYYMKTIMNVFFASIVFFIVTFFMFYNMENFPMPIYDMFVEKSFSESFMGILLVLICLLIGVVAFAITFIFLEKSRSDNIKEIKKAIYNIENGNFENNLMIYSNDDLADIANSINIMQHKIYKLVEAEKESEKTKNELITNVAHDLRTPLTSIRGYLELIETNKNLDISQKDKYIEIAFEKTKKLEILIEELFSFTKMTYGKVSLKLTKINIVELLNQLVEEMYPLFEKNQMNFKIVTNKNNIFANLDSMLTVRLFENLINNAIKYGKDGKLLKINIFDNDNNVDVSVVNYGKLIPKESLDRLFDKFYRIDESRSREEGGTGLGLAIAKNIVDLHEGEIKVSSDLNGTIFKVSLPKNLKI